MTASRRRDEAGAVALLIAISMVGMCAAAAMVIDLGLLRVDRQVDKSAEDASAMAGANGLVANLYSPVPFRPFAGVCQAVNYLKANSSDFKTFSAESWEDGNGIHLGGSGFGCAAAQANAPCTPDNASTWARFTGISTDGKSVVRIQSGYTVTGGNISTVTGGDFREESLSALSGDAGVATYGGCDQLAVIINRTRSATLGSVADVSQTGTTTRSVARVTVKPPTSPYALLILERDECQVLTNGTNGAAKIEVLGYKNNPGMIHSDSAGDDTGPSCNKPVITGAKPDGVVAKAAPLTNAPGQISTVATSNQSDGLANVYAGPKPPGSNPVSSSRVTRVVADQVYLDGVTQARNDAAFAWTAASTGTVPADTIGVTVGPWTKVNNCAAASGNITATKVLVMCDNMNNAASFPNATDLIFSGQLNGTNGIAMPKAVNVYVVGKSSPFGVSPGSGSLTMHDNGAACPSTFDSSGSRAKLFIFNGSLQVNGGTFRACGTTVILLSGRTDACLPTLTPTYIIDNQPCGGATGNGVIDFQGNGSVDWTAPNLDDDEVSTPLADRPKLEDLALWTEAGGVQGLGGSGTVHLAGVFVAPNAKPLKLNGSPTWLVKNSQYVVRSLTNNGGAIFTMQPSPALPVAPPNVIFSLVR